MSVLGSCSGQNLSLMYMYLFFRINGAIVVYVKLGWPNCQTILYSLLHDFEGVYCDQTKHMCMGHFPYYQNPCIILFSVSIIKQLLPFVHSALSCLVADSATSVVCVWRRQTRIISQRRCYCVNSGIGITQTFPCNILQYFKAVKMVIFRWKKCDIFAQNIDHGNLLEPPHWGGSNEYPQSLF